MSEEATQDTGSQEVAGAGAAVETAAPVSFLDSLPEEYRAEASIKNFTSAADLAKSYIHAQRMIGADKIALPGKAATDDEWRAVYKRLGAPDDPKAYDVKIGEGLLGDNELGGFKNAAFEAGLNNRQAERMAQFIEKSLTDAQSGREQSIEEARYNSEQELRQEWGRAFDEKVQMAYKAASTFLGDTNLLDSVELADGRLLGDHPEIVRMFAKLASEIGEDKLEGAPSEMVMTPAEAKAKIDELRRQGSPYWVKMHPEHDAYVQEVNRLFEYAS